MGFGVMRFVAFRRRLGLKNLELYTDSERPLGSSLVVQMNTAWLGATYHGYKAEDELS
jgi:hypothetical protein